MAMPAEKMISPGRHVGRRTPAPISARTVRTLERWNATATRALRVMEQTIRRADPRDTYGLSVELGHVKEEHRLLGLVLLWTSRAAEDARDE